MSLIPRSSLFNFDNMFEDFFAPSRLFSDTDRGFFSPRVDIKEGKDHYEITAELPGVSKDDLNVTLQNGVLTIEAQTQEEKKEEKEGKVIHRERRYGKFVRSFNLGGDVQEKDIDAGFKDGVLTLTAPRREAAQPETRRIAIQ
ncbi:Hsp20/alpha crystallin family protein [Exilibacterium tricleocarpae]|uniref:Hsp20/alpha crystallin family protein n=1 Tax=Exilibacterium tricleocarpae TaxID=2591008 RepID=A0A545TV63_9GAMM|nr:Hsp20/alpha crystallin family protein [Exilibacterium tricleocarpae]TQV81110.1 Hsp20/alpha crystallin family protein [Exilibacterium tricleocarpae]